MLVRMMFSSRTVVSAGFNSTNGVARRTLSVSMWEKRLVTSKTRVVPAGPRGCISMLEKWVGGLLDWGWEGPPSSLPLWMGNQLVTS